ncbi:MAG: hypothetical protein ACPF9D_04405 [Owenweeksia sp.]
MRIITFSLASLILFSSCATIFSKSAYPVNITSNPQGANFTITDRDGAEVVKGKTPQIVTLNSSAGYFKKENYTVTYTKSNGEEVKLPITFHVDGWYIAGNFFIGGLLGYLLIDPLTGAMYTADQKIVSANLGSDDTSSNAGNSADPTLRVMNISDYTGDKAALIRIN